MKIFDIHHKLESLWKNIGIDLENYWDSKEMGSSRRLGILDIMMNYKPDERAINAYVIVLEHTDLKHNNPIELYRAFAACRHDLSDKVLASKESTKENTGYFLLNILLLGNQLKLMYDGGGKFDERVKDRNRLHALMACNEIIVLDHIDNPRTELDILENYFVNRKVCEEIGGFHFKKYSIGNKSLEDLTTASYMSYRTIKLKSKLNEEATDSDWSIFFDYVKKAIKKIKSHADIRYANALYAFSIESVKHLESLNDQENLEKARKLFSECSTKRESLYKLGSTK